MDTKACSLTEDEVKALIMTHAREMDEDNLEDSLERMNYLNRRLKAFNEIEKPEDQPKAIQSEAPTEKATTTW